MEFNIIKDKKSQLAYRHHCKALILAEMACEICLRYAANASKSNLTQITYHLKNLAITTAYHSPMSKVYICLDDSKVLEVKNEDEVVYFVEGSWEKIIPNLYKKVLQKTAYDCSLQEYARQMVAMFDYYRAFFGTNYAPLMEDMDKNGFGIDIDGDNEHCKIACANDVAEIIPYSAFDTSICHKYPEGRSVTVHMLDEDGQYTSYLSRYILVTNRLPQVLFEAIRVSIFELCLEKSLMDSKTIEKAYCKFLNR